MRRLLAIALAVALAACAPAAVAPPLAEPTAEPSAVPSQAAPTAEATALPSQSAPTPEESPAVASPSVQPTEPPNSGPPQVSPPKVALVQQAFAVGALPPTASATPEELELTRQGLEGWTSSFAQMLTSYQGLYAADALIQNKLKAGFDAMILSGPFAEVLKIWALRDPRDTRTFTTGDAKILKLYAKPWGRAGYADIAFKLIESGGAQDSTRDLRLRVAVGRFWRVIDVWDTGTARWLAGETPQYSALALESEAPSAVANYLWNESYVAGGSEQFAQRPGLSTFLQARIDALNSLNNAFKSNRIVDRHFEGATVRIVRFDPATYLGDGVLTVSVSGRVVVTDGSGTSRETPFTQQMKFLRSIRGGFSPDLNAIDQQSTDGTWDSGGDLALYAVDVEFG